MIRLSPVWRISIGLAFMSVALVLSGDFLFDLSAGRSADLFKERKKLIESLALEYSQLALEGRSGAMVTKMKDLIVKDDQIASCALKTADGKLLAQAGDHETHWDPPPAGTSTLDHIQVPIFQNEQRWGTLEVSFTGRGPFSEILFLANPLLKLLLFIAVVGLFSYLLFMKRVLKHLDPSAVVPERVKTAMDILTEGVMFLDEKGLIVLANAAIAKKMGTDMASLLGRDVGGFQWLDTKSGRPHEGFPYLKELLAGQVIRRVYLDLKTADGKVHKLVVNASAIKDPKGMLRGALISMDDITLLEKTNQRLLKLTTELQYSRKQVEHQNKKLKLLATRDPLTGCYNRRALFERFDAMFDRARAQHSEICCIMTDIDHFKTFNDTYGHAVGDKVLQIVAKILGIGLRQNDIVARYGGEEFCLIIAGATLDQGVRVAERARAAIESKAGRSLRSKEDIRVTASFGVSSIKLDAANPEALIDQADQALYKAKEAGRNQVIRFDEIKTKPFLHQISPAEYKEPQLSPR
jgi:diguanylate cyclase (GGDEF)-like protein/PAS domain S-box-containing protein